MTEAEAAGSEHNTWGGSLAAGDISVPPRAVRVITGNLLHFCVSTRSVLAKKVLRFSQLGRECFKNTNGHSWGL